MTHYIVNLNAQSNGDHEVHNKTTGCIFMPDPSNQLNLGHHESCHEAVVEARRYCKQANGCRHCTGECHSS